MSKVGKKRSTGCSDGPLSTRLCQWTRRGQCRATQRDRHHQFTPRSNRARPRHPSFRTPCRTSHAAPSSTLGPPRQPCAHEWERSHCFRISSSSSSSSSSTRRRRRRHRRRHHTHRTRHRHLTISLRRIIHPAPPNKRITRNSHRHRQHRPNSFRHSRHRRLMPPLACRPTCSCLRSLNPRHRWRRLTHRHGYRTPGQRSQHHRCHQRQHTHRHRRHRRRLHPFSQRRRWHRRRHPGRKSRSLPHEGAPKGGGRHRTSQCPPTIRSGGRAAWCHRTPLPF